MARNNIIRMIGLFLVAIMLAACTRYEQQVVPFKMPSAYPNATGAGGAAIAAKAFDDSKEAEQSFGFDIRGAGILPVQVIFDNAGNHPLVIIPEQTLLVDTDSNLWSILEENMVYDRIEKKTEIGNILPEAGKTGVLAGVAGAIIGAAIGIVTGHNIGEAIGKGAAIGAAGGIIVGGSKALSEPEVRYQIREDLAKRALAKKAIPPHEIAHGFIFFPGEAKKAGELRLSIREVDTGKSYKLIMKF